MNLVLLGAPGAGKGTQAEKIQHALNIPILSTGNLLRQAIAAGTELGRKAQTYMDGGNLVPDELIIGLVAERLKSPDCANGVIFDGFPRTLPQAQALDRAAKVDVVLSIEVADETIMQRMSGRRTCPQCQASYHVTDNPPQKEGVCDKCGAQLSIRHDDEPDTVRSRLEVYHRQTEPIKEYYGAQGKLKKVQGQPKLADTVKLVSEALGVSL